MWPMWPMWPVLSFVKIWQGHHNVWPPQSEVKSRSFRQHSRDLELGVVYPLIDSLSGRDSMHLVNLSLKCSRSWIMFVWWGIAFNNNLGPRTANESSNKVCFAAELAFRVAGISARTPSLGRKTNWTFGSLLVFSLRIFHIYFSHVLNTEILWHEVK